MRRASRAFGMAAIASGAIVMPMSTVASGSGGAPSVASADASTTFAKQLTPGWNLGNALESLGHDVRPPATVSQETAYGNPVVSQKVLDTVAAAGFRSVRIPVSWLQYADGNDNISASWLTRVAQVVDYARNAGLYVIINVHYDGGWLQPTLTAQPAANARLSKFWMQIATKFANYDDHVLFAGTNEIAVTNVYSAPTAENCAVQKGFNQAFVDAVRATGGNNSSRYLVVQGYNTNIDYTVSCNHVMPSDSVSNHLMMEVHYYDPYNFSLNDKSDAWQWGATATDASKKDGFGDERYVDAQFQKMKLNFIDKGIPVILGEYGAISKKQHDPSGNYRMLWDQYITHSAYRHGMAPIYWDNGDIGDHGTGLFDRDKATKAYPATIDAIVNAAH